MTQYDVANFRYTSMLAIVVLNTLCLTLLNYLRIRGPGVRTNDLLATVRCKWLDSLLQGTTGPQTETTWDTPSFLDS